MKNPLLLLAATLLLAGCSSRAAIRHEQQQRQHEHQQVAKRSDKVFVCHGNKKTQWLEVGEASADAHSRHGDRISTRAERAGQSCQN